MSAARDEVAGSSPTTESASVATRSATSLFMIRTPTRRSARVKSSAAVELFDALRAVSTGRQYVTPSIAKMLEEAAASGRKSRSSGRALSPRQRQVLQLLAEGNTMKEAAAALGLTARTVAFHKYQVMNLFQLKSTADLVQLAINERLISTRRQPCQF